MLECWSCVCVRAVAVVGVAGVLKSLPMISVPDNSYCMTDQCSYRGRERERGQLETVLHCYTVTLLHNLYCKTTTYNCDTECEQRKNTDLLSDITE